VRQVFDKGTGGQTSRGRPLFVVFTVRPTEYADWRGAKRQKLPALKPTLRTISLRFPFQ